MAACMLCRLVPRLRYLPGLRKYSSEAQHVSVKVADETDQEGTKGILQHQEASLLRGYRLFYKPSSYHSVCNTAASQSQTDNDEDECPSILAPSFRRQSNGCTINCLRHLSSSKNTLLDFDLKNGSEPETQTVSHNNGNNNDPDVRFDARAFQKCRSEYDSMTYDLTKRPPPMEWKDTLLLLEKVTLLKDTMKPSEVCDFLVELSHVCPDRRSLISADRRFITLLRYSVEHLHLFTTPQLMEVLQAFVWLDIPHDVLGHYETELNTRVDHMTLHQLLLAADLWRRMKMQVPHFLKHLYDSIPLYLGQMGVPELVQLMYIIGEGRQCPKDLVNPVVQLIMLHLHRMYPEEVGIICLALFKSQTSIPESAVTRIVDKAHSVVNKMTDFAMVNVLKFLRFSYRHHPMWFKAMAQEVPRRAHRVGISGLMHVALACSALHYRDDRILIPIAERIPPLMEHCRSKDLGKLSWAFGQLGFLPDLSPNLYPSLMETLRQKKVQFQRYPEQLLTGLVGLAFVSQFPEDLIALALSPKFVDLAVKFRRLELRTDLFTLDETVGLELPQWTGPRLSSELKKEVTEKLWKFAQSDVCLKPEVQEAEACLQELLGGDKFVSKRMILPHTRSIDLEVHLDSTGQPIPVEPASDTVVVSPENNTSKSPYRQSWERMNLGVNITDDLLAQLTNANHPAEPFTPASTFKPSMQKLQPEYSGSLFNTGVLLTNEMKEALIRPIRRASAPQTSQGPVRLAIQVSTRNHYCHRSPQLLGLHAMKRRQLALAGYKVVELNFREWFPMLRKSKTEKLAYLHCKVYDSQWL